MKLDNEAVVAHTFRNTTADSFFGLRLGMNPDAVIAAIGDGGKRTAGEIHWERPGPSGLTERVGAMFRPNADDLIGADVMFFSHEVGAGKSIRELAKVLKEELGKRFKPIEDKSTFKFVVGKRVNRLWIGTGELKDPDNYSAHVKITLSDPEY